MNYNIHIIRKIYILLCCFGFIACSTDELTSLKDSQTVESPIAQEAMEYIKNKKISLSLPDMHRTLHKEGQDNTRAAGLKFSPSDIRPDWNSMQTFENEEGNTWLFPLISTTPISGTVYTRIKGKVLAQATITSSKLLIKKKEGKLIGRIVTYIPERKFVRIKGNSVEKLGFQLRGSNFSGVYLVSSLNGIWIYGEKYDEGRLVFRFGPNLNKSKTRGTVPNVGGGNPNEYKIFLELFSKSQSKRSVMSYSSSEQEAFYCSFCGSPADDCNCVTIYPDDYPQSYCEICGGPFEDCYCCSVCHEYPCTCEDSGGSSGGGSSGGGSSGGGSSGGGGGNQQVSVLFKKIPFSSANFPGYGSNGMDCLRLSDYIIRAILGSNANVGDVNNAYFLKKSDGKGNVIITGNAKTASELIINHLNANRPIKVGVDYRNGGNQSDHLTDHWIVINGRGYDNVKQQIYFNYIETGRSKDAASMAVGDNRLYYNADEGTISGPKWTNKQIYNVVQIRPNK